MKIAIQTTGPLDMLQSMLDAKSGSWGICCLSNISLGMHTWERLTLYGPHDRLTVSNNRSYEAPGPSRNGNGRLR
jgi:hypothetical protein